MAYYITSYNSVDLQATCGLVTPEVAGVHGLPASAVVVQTMPGAVTPHISEGESQFRTITFKGIIEAADHATLVANIAAFAATLRADTSFHPLVVADRSGQEIMARQVQAFEVAETYLPNDYTAVKVTLPMLCYPYWQDDTDNDEDITTATGTLTSAGQIDTYPVYTLTVASAMVGGLYFEINGNRWTWTGDLDPGDVLVIYSDVQLCDSTLNGTRDWTKVTCTDQTLLHLGPGANTVALSDYTKFSLNAVWRDRFW